MKLRLLILLAAALAAAPAAGQTVKSLGYNTTNGFVTYSGTNSLTFTNALQFATNARAATRTNLGGTTVGNAVFTATNAAAARSAIGAGTVNEGGEPSFESVTANLFTAESINEATGGLQALDLLNFSLTFGTNYVLEWSATDVQLNKPLTFFGTNTAATTRTNLGLGATNAVTFSNITATGTLGVSNTATFATNVTVNGNISVGSLTTTTPSTWALDATQTAAATNGILALPSNANVIRLTNNNAISGVSGGVLGAFYYLVNQTTNAVTISNVGGITVQGGTSLTLGANQAATLVATGATNASVAARGDLNDVTLGGTANTAPSQTASSGSSLMTRDLGDARYGNIVFDELTADQSFTGTTNQNTLLSAVLDAGTYHYDSVVNYSTASATAGATILMQVNTGSDFATGTTIEGQINNAPAMMRISSGAGPVNFVAIATASGISGQTRSGTASGTIKLAGASTLTMTAAQRDATDATNALVLTKGSFVLFRKTP